MADWPLPSTCCDRSIQRADIQMWKQKQAGRPRGGQSAPRDIQFSRPHESSTRTNHGPRGPTGGTG
eukprot:9807589-Lingulodinium_polyedra.AAC.1